jgi:YVTN family beta-propeller protein
LSGLGIVVFVSVIILPYDISAQTLHNQTLEEIVKPKDTLEDNPQIDVGDGPQNIEINPENRDKSTGLITSIIYVANFWSNTISVISGDNNNKIKDIPVRNSPSDIAIDYNTNTIYVANINDDTVSVINGTDYTKIKDIPVAYGPQRIIAVGDIVYVATDYNNTISVIDGTDYSVIKNIPVGDNPVDLKHLTISDEKGVKNWLYVANAGHPYNQSSDTVSVINGTDYTKIKDIPVGDNPQSIEMKFRTVYVANAGDPYNQSSGTVSVINGSDYSVIKDIPVGDNPVDLEYLTISDEKGVKNWLYVAGSLINSTRGTVSVINATSNTWLKNIDVGDLPSSIVLNEDENILYVANSGSGTVSIISADNNTKIKDIPVGNGLRDIAIDYNTNTIYVANYISNGVSVIDGVTNKVVARTKFDIKPSDSGNIICGNGLNPPLNQSFYVSSDTECTAIPNKGFEFLSWVENLNDKSTRTIQTSTDDSFLDSILDLFGYKPSDPAQTLNVVQFGSFTANFKELPPPLPPEYWGILFTIIISSILGSWFIPGITNWGKSKWQTRRLNRLHNTIESMYEDGKLDENDIEALNKLNNYITHAFVKGKITDQHYSHLKNEISVLYEEIHRKRIDSLNGRYDIHNGKLLDQIKYDIEDAYAKGKITDQHYKLLNKKIESSETTSDNKTNQDNVGTANKTHISKRSPI